MHVVCIKCVLRTDVTDVLHRSSRFLCQIPRQCAVPVLRAHAELHGRSREDVGPEGSEPGHHLLRYPSNVLLLPVFTQQTPHKVGRCYLC